MLSCNSLRTHSEFGHFCLNPAAFAVAPTMHLWLFHDIPLTALTSLPFVAQLLYTDEARTQDLKQKLLITFLQCIFHVCKSISSQIRPNKKRYLWITALSSNNIHRNTNHIKILWGTVSIGSTCSNVGRLFEGDIHISTSILTSPTLACFALITHL